MLNDQRMWPRVAVAVLCAVVCVPAGCQEKGAPKPPATVPTPPAGAAAPPTAPGAPAARPAPGGAPAAVQGAGGKTSGPQDDPTVIEVAGLTLKKPASWVWTAPSMQFRVLQYSVPAVGGDAPAAELVFSVFAAGDGGPVGANLDRWAGQFMNADATAPAPSTRTESTINGMTVSRIESKGSYMGMGQAAPRPGQMQLGAIVQAPGRNVFIKLVGPEATVESNRASFDAMLESAK